MTTAPYAPAVAPPVVTWFKVYAGIMALIYLLMVGLGMIFFVFPDIADGEDDAWIAGMFMAAIGVPLLVLFAMGVFLRAKPWVWIYDLVLICIGFMSCLTLPFCIALLIFWLKPETKAYFGRT